MKVLYISYDGLTDSLGQSQIIPYLKGMASDGHHLTILSAEKKHHLAQMGGQIKDDLSGFHINWFYIGYTSTPAIFSTLFDFFYLKFLAKKLYRQYHFDAVHCRSYIPALIGLGLKKRFGIRFIFDMRGFWADERVDGRIWVLKNPVFSLIYRYFKKMEKIFLTSADAIISLTEAGKKEILEWPLLSNQNLKIDVIPCCADTTHFNPLLQHPSEIQKKQDELRLHHDDLILSYLGSVGTWYMLDEMLDFFIRLLKRKRNARFLFITPEPVQCIMDAAFKKNIPHENIIIAKSSREEVPLYICLSHVSIFFIKPVYSKKASSPTKQAEVMSMGIPLICNSGVGDTDEIIQITKAGLLVEEFNDETYDHVIDQLDNLLKVPKEMIREAAITHLSLKNGIKKYLSIYRRLEDNS